MSHTPTQIEPLNSTTLKLVWENHQKFSVPYVEVRYYCPCASCIDEHTGQRTIQKISIDPAIRPTEVRTVGRYAIQITWSDGHDTGMYHYDRLFELCEKQGTPLP